MTAPLETEVPVRDPVLQRDARSTSGEHAREIVIEPPRRWGVLDVAELWQYRELLVTLVARELQLRYAQTWVGVAWVILKPLATMLLLWGMFGAVAAMPTDGIPYPVFFFSGLVLWFFLSGAITDSNNSLVVNADLVRKVYFPRALFPIATVAARLVDLGIMLLFLAALMLYYGIPRAPRFGVLLSLSAVAALLAVAIGLLISALNVKYRDATHVVPVALQLLMFASPVVYSSHLVPEAWRVIYSLNPLVGIIDGFRAALLDRPLPAGAIAIAAGVTGGLLGCALVMFRRMEASFADYV